MKSIRPQGKATEMLECVNCQATLTGGNLTLPWEDGDNPYAYVTCRECRHENTVYGFGEDD